MKEELKWINTCMVQLQFDGRGKKSNAKAENMRRNMQVNLLNCGKGFGRVPAFSDFGY